MRSGSATEKCSGSFEVEVCDHPVLSFNITKICSIQKRHLIFQDGDNNKLPVIHHSYPSEKVVEMVKQVIEWRGKPQAIRTDNGTEFIAKAFEGFCDNANIEHRKIQKGKPNQNAFIERFNRSYREDVLDANIFETMNQVREMSSVWMDDYNNNHPHASLDDLTLIEFMKKRMNL